MHPENQTSSNWQKALALANASRRCGAETRSGGSCVSPAMLNGRCRLHGGKSPGAPKGESHGRYVNGLYTLESKLIRQHVALLNQQAKELTRSISSPGLRSQL